MSQERLQQGAEGESLAARHLEALGWKILERRWRCKLGELDLIAEDGETVVFVEVRTRRAGAKVSPRESVGPGKQKQVARTALFYVRGKNLRRRMRFDVIAISLTSPPTVDHFKGAFELPRALW